MAQVTSKSDVVQRVVDIIERQTGWCDPLTKSEARISGNALAALSPKQRTKALSLVNDGAARRLGKRLSGLPEPKYRQLGRAIQARRSTVMGIRLEAPPEQREVASNVIRAMFGHRPGLARRVGLVLRRVVIGPPASSLSRLPEAWGRNARGLHNVLYVSVAGFASTDTLVHELGHAVHVVLSPKQHWSVYRAYRHAKAENLVNGYGTTNPAEFFAEAVEFYLTDRTDRTRFGPLPFAHATPREILAKHHPELFRLMQDLFGEPEPIPVLGITGSGSSH